MQTSSNRDYYRDYSLSEEDFHTLRSKIASIPANEQEDQETRRFDLMMLRLELAILKKTKEQQGLTERLKELAQNLSEKGSIPSVAAQMELLLDIVQDAFCQDVTLPNLESARIRLRALVKFADKDQGRDKVYVNFEDQLGEATPVVITGTDPTLNQYRERLKHYLKEHLEHPAVMKIRTNQRLTKADVQAIESMLFGDKVVTPEKLNDVIGDQGPLTMFVRRIVGLDKEAAKQAFVEIFGASLTAKQLVFMNQLIEFLSANGVMETGELFQPPFTYLHDQSVDGLLPEQAGKIVKIIEQINSNANVN